LSEEPIEVFDLGDISAYAGEIFADLSHRLGQLRFTAPRDEHVGAFGDEPFRRSKADAATSAGNQRNFAVKLLHVVAPPFLIASWDAGRRRSVSYV